MDAFLEEQIRRIRALSDRMSALEHRAAELSSEVEKDRQQGRLGPLQEVRDFRICRRSRERPTSQDSPQRRESSRRRKRR
jgi:hypothetical protein